MDATVGSVIVASIVAAASLGLGLINRRAHAKTSEATDLVRSDANERMDALREHVAQLRDQVAELTETGKRNASEIAELKIALRECFHARDALEREKLLLLEKLLEVRTAHRKGDND